MRNRIHSVSPFVTVILVLCLLLPMMSLAQEAERNPFSSKVKDIAQAREKDLSTNRREVPLLC